ncbi:hypothetical protein RM780_04845 [Streptomyces sp. DSM 44917]|uniref:Uncharacterized protein n=1 Tax=Streptomyces boetiae TaxID=3075541 RepID=A0ABU2L403_9ACTN|nr:hypothetical protein [Streptomyces sp. DSM 44917]MDT0306290.1 hypothetical protein [Streptomyces sp. DSM 44917]
MSTQSLPVWLPTTDQGVQMLPAHRWWDAVRLPGFVGFRVLYRLRCVRGCGAVVQDQEADTLTWLVRVGAADGWEAINAEVLRMGVVPVPPARYCAGTFTGGASIRWLVPPAGACLTEPGPLRAALCLAHQETRRA